jgi:hypothetical protein
MTTSFYAALFFLLLSVPGRAQLPIWAMLKRQPAGRPTGRPTSTGHAAKVTTPWVVYSDRTNNPTYREPNLAVKFKQLRFGEACYVLAERKGFLRLVQYDAALKIGTFYAPRLLKSRKGAKYVGWVPKTRLLLTSHAPTDSARALPTLYCAALTSSRILLNTTQFLRHDSLQLFAQPSLTSLSPYRLRLYDLTYVYKFSDSGNEALVGPAEEFVTDSAAKFLLGWAPTTALQPLGHGLFLEPDTVHRSQADYHLYNSPSQAWLSKPDSLAQARAFPSVPWSSKEPHIPVLKQYRQWGSLGYSRRSWPRATTPC